MANENRLDEMGKALGLKDGDVILKINGEDLPDLGPELGAFVQKHTMNLETMETLT